MATLFQDYMNILKPVQPAPPGLVGGLGQGGLMDQFATEFGNRWKKTPIKGTYFIAGRSKNIQFTTRWISPRHGWEVAYYDFKDEDDFKDVFVNHKEALAGNAEYFFMDEKNKYSALDLIQYMAGRKVQWQ